MRRSIDTRLTQLEAARDEGGGRWAPYLAELRRLDAYLRKNDYTPAPLVDETVKRMAEPSVPDDDALRAELDRELRPAEPKWLRYYSLAGIVVGFARRLRDEADDDVDRAEWWRHANLPSWAAADAAFHARSEIRRARDFLRNGRGGERPADVAMYAFFGLPGSVQDKDEGGLVSGATEGRPDAADAILCEIDAELP